MRHIHRLVQQCLDQAIRDGLIAGTSPERFSIHSKEGQRQCADTSRSGGLSGHSGVVEPPPHVPAGADRGTSAKRS